MRAFIAIDLPDEVREELAIVQRELQPVSNSAKWVAPSLIHLTLKFLGEINDQLVEEVHQNMTGISWKPFQITVKGVGFFPGARSPRIFWAGLIAPNLETLAQRINARMEPLGIENERRRFRPHITLARASKARLESSLVTAATQFEEHDFGTFNVDRCYLYQSETKPTGPVYTQLREYMLS